VISETTSYLVDTDDDELYDVFYNSASGLKTTVERNRKKKLVERAKRRFF